MKKWLDRSKREREGRLYVTCGVGCRKLAAGLCIEEMCNWFVFSPEIWTAGMLKILGEGPGVQAGFAARSVVRLCQSM